MYTEVIIIYRIIYVYTDLSRRMWDYIHPCLYSVCILSCTVCLYPSVSVPLNFLSDPDPDPDPT